MRNATRVYRVERTFKPLGDKPVTGGWNLFAKRSHQNDNDWATRTELDSASNNAFFYLDSIFGKEEYDDDDLG